MAEVLRKVSEQSSNNETIAQVKKKNTFAAPKSHKVEEEKVPYIPIREINLDDNGLTDTAFASILSALVT